MNLTFAADTVKKNSTVAATAATVLFLLWDLSGFGAFQAAFGALGAGACHGEDVRREGEGLLRAARVAFYRQGHKAVHQLVEAYAGAFPQVEGEGAGDGVDFVHIYLTVFAVDHNVDTAHAVARQDAECLGSEILNLFGFLLGEVGGEFLGRGLHPFGTLVSAEVFGVVGEDFR